MSHPLWKYLQQTITPKPEELGAEIFREGSSPPTCHVSNVMCHVSRVTSHVSHVTCHKSIFFLFFLLFFDKVVKLVCVGSVIKGATPSSFHNSPLLEITAILLFLDQNWNIAVCTAIFLSSQNRQIFVKEIIWMFWSNG